MLPAHFDDVNCDLSDHNVGNILDCAKILPVILCMTSCFTRILLGITVVLLCFVLGFYAAMILTQVAQELVYKFWTYSKLVIPTRASTRSTEVSG